jgi:hypothetical protein
VLEVGAHLEEAAREVAGAGDVARLPLVALAHVEDLHAAPVRPIEERPHLLRRDLAHLGERIRDQIR